MTLLIDASSPAVFTASATTATSATFTPPDGSVLVVFYAGNSTGGANPSAPTITDNLGTHLTYDRKVWRSRADGSPTVNGHCAIWVAEVATGAAMTVSISQSVAEKACHVLVLTGQNPGAFVGAFGGAGSASASAVAQDYTAAASSGQGFGVVCDWDALGSMTAGSGCTLSGTGSVGGGQISYGFVHRTLPDDSNGATNTLNVNAAGTSTNLQWAWVEILELPPNPDDLDPPRVTMPHWLLRYFLQKATMRATDLESREVQVRATQAGSTFNGMALTVRVLTGQHAAPVGATVTSGSITTPALAITPNASGSIVYGAILNANGTGSWTANASTTLIQNIPDTANGSCYGTYRATAATTAATPVTVGASAPTGASPGGICHAEILSAGTLAEDASAPAAVSTFVAQTVATNLFTPPPGALLVAIVSSDGGAAVCTMGVTGGGLIWTELVKANASGSGYVGVWTALVPGAAASALTVDATDDAGLTDGAIIDQLKEATDSAGLTDTRALDIGMERTDSAGLTDSSTVQSAKLVTATDSVGLTDTAAVQSAKLVTVDDSAGLTDTRVFDIGLARTDSAGLTDTAAVVQALVRTDSAGLTDTASIQSAKLVTADDSAGLTDSSTIQVAKLVVVTDSAGLTDSRALAIASERTDSAGLTDTAGLARTMLFTDSAGLTDTVGFTKNIAATDSAGLTDSATAVRIKAIDVTDSAGLTDGVITDMQSGTVVLPPGLIPVRTFTEAELLTGNRVTRLRYDLYDQDESALGNLTGVEKGSIDFTAGGSVKSGGTLDIVDVGQTVNWLSDRVRPVFIIDGVGEIPLGMFVFSEAPQEWEDTGRSWQVKLLDKTSILDQDKVDGTYALDVGTAVIDAVIELIESTGETSIAVTPSADVLAGPLVWEAGTTKLRIVNDLLAVAGYFSLFCDANGQYRGEPYVRPANRPIRYEFLDGATSIYSPDFEIDVDLFAIPNKFVAVGQGSGDIEGLISVATNTDPTSPYSFAARGRWIVATATGVEAADQTVLDAYARRRLIELTSPTSSIEVAHMMVPDLTFNNAVRLRRVPAGVDARHVVVKMVVTLDPTALVKTTLQEVVDL